MKNNKGQALIELIVFLPLIIGLYSVIGGYATSINGSINQQKLTRSYFYYRIQNNSTIPGTRSGNFDSWRKFGMFYIGWKDKYENGDQPVMPCYKVNIPFKDSPEDKCDEPYNKTSTLWVRVGTVYGICGGTYIRKEQHDIHLVPNGGTTNFSEAFDQSSCTIAQ